MFLAKSQRAQRFRKTERLTTLRRSEAVQGTARFAGGTETRRSEPEEVRPNQI
jgi:hypothetical protein